MSKKNNNQVGKKDNKEMHKFSDFNKNVKPSGVKLRGFEVVDKEHRQTDGEVILPIRGTSEACGYDIVATEDLVIRPQEKIMFMTDVKAYMKENEFLSIHVRSSLGCKKDLMLSNSEAIIDRDFHNNPSNDGNIGISLRNLKPKLELEGTKQIRIYNSDVVDLPIVKDLTEENTITIKKGERVCQGIFMEYKPSDNCNTDIERKGGIGSTGEI